jgi:hypothetical protein
MSISIPVLRICGYAEETYGPHAGCAEFMTEPETYRCASVAVVKLTFKTIVGKNDFEVFTEDYAIDACDFHAGALKGDGDDELLRETPLIETMGLEKETGEGVDLLFVSRFTDSACLKAAHRIQGADGAYLTEDMTASEAIAWIKAQGLRPTPGVRQPIA